LHTPALQTALGPHEVPAATGVPVSLHTAVPVEQSVLPTSQGLVGVHAALCAHDVHVPLEQTSFVPHTVPFGACVPVSVQVEGLAEQSRVPVSHELAGVHAAPLVHVVHAPLSHTWPVPQDVPFGTSFCVFVHTEAPVAQLVAQTVHELAGVQTVPAVHATQLVPWQTMFRPHDVPAATAVPVSLQTGSPDAQSVVPLSHGFVVGVHCALWVHAPQFPSSQTWLAPQLVPLGTLSPVSLHVCVPVEQSLTPMWHRLDAGKQTAFAVHPMHAPLSQT
jgi:hypothetical protein